MPKAMISNPLLGGDSIQIQAWIQIQKQTQAIQIEKQKAKILRFNGALTNIHLINIVVVHKWF